MTPAVASPSRRATLAATIDRLRTEGVPSGAADAELVVRARIARDHAREALRKAESDLAATEHRATVASLAHERAIALAEAELRATAPAPIDRALRALETAETLVRRFGLLAAEQHRLTTDLRTARARLEVLRHTPFEDGPELRGEIVSIFGAIADLPTHVRTVITQEALS